MIPILQVKNSNGEWIEVPAIKGNNGDSGVYIGAEEPTNNANVWIDTQGEDTDITSTDIIDILGYTPAKQDDVTNLSEEIVELKALLVDGNEVEY
jgi:hypothetical protein